MKKTYLVVAVEYEGEPPVDGDELKLHITSRSSGQIVRNESHPATVLDWFDSTDGAPTYVATDLGKGDEPVDHEGPIAEQRADILGRMEKLRQTTGAVGDVTVAVNNGLGLTPKLENVEVDGEPQDLRDVHKREN